MFNCCRMAAAMSWTVTLASASCRVMACHTCSVTSDKNAQTTRANSLRRSLFVPLAVTSSALLELRLGCRCRSVLAAALLCRALVQHSCQRCLACMADVAAWQSRWAPGNCGNSLALRGYLCQRYGSQCPASKYPASSLADHAYKLNVRLPQAARRPSCTEQASMRRDAILPQSTALSARQLASGSSDGRAGVGGENLQYVYRQSSLLAIPT